MAIGIDRGEVLHPLEVELLCAFAEVSAPFPLEIPSAGETEVERMVLYQGAREMLSERGLADDAGPLGVADDFVYLLRNATGAVDLVLAKEKTTFGAVVLAYRSDALLVTQDFTEVDRLVRMKAITLDDAVDELIRLVPTVAPSPGAPFNLPRRAVEAVFQEILKRAPESGHDAALSDMDTTVEIRPPQQMRTEELEDLLAGHGIEERVGRRMVANLQPVLGSGQTGVAKRDQTEDQWHRAGDELRWLDTPRGRFRLAEDGEWISVNPLAGDEIRSTFRSLAATIR